MHWFAPLYAALILFYPLAHAVNGANCAAELTQHLEQLEARITNGRFKLSRGMTAYEHLLTTHKMPKLEQDLRALPAGAVWLDLGSGYAMAQRSFWHSREPRRDLKMVATSFNEPVSDWAFSEDRANIGKHLRFIETGFLQSAWQDPDHAIHSLRGRVDYLTDVYGPFAYMPDIQSAFEIIADLLKVGGQARLVFPHNTRVFDPDLGHELSRVHLARALCRLTGYQLELVEAGPTVVGEWVGHFRKVKESSERSGNRLRLIRLEDGSPPDRTYHLVRVKK